MTGQGGKLVDIPLSSLTPHYRQLGDPAQEASKQPRYAVSQAVFDARLNELTPAGQPCWDGPPELTAPITALEA